MSVLEQLPPTLPQRPPSTSRGGRRRIDASPSPRRSPLRRPHPGLLASLGAALIAAVHLVNLSGWPRYFDDEGTYYSQAWAVQHLGALAPYTYWYDHPPVGWLQLAAFTWLPDLLLDDPNSALLAGRFVMVGYTAATAVLVFMLARRLALPSGWALAAMLLWGLNPLVLFEGRQVFLDNVALPWLIASFVLALNRRRDLWRYMAAGLCFGVAVLSKETVLVVAPALVVAVWQSAFRPTRAFALTGMILMTTVTGGMYLLFAAVRDELFPGTEHVSLWDALMFQFSDRASSGFILDSSSGAGGAYGTLQSWLDQDPYLLLAGLVSGLVCLLPRRLRPIGLAVVLLAAVAMRPGGYLPAMYVIAILPFCALAVVAFAHAGWSSATSWERPWQRALAVVCLVPALASQLPAVLDWRYSYREAFTQDLNDEHAAALDVIAAELPASSTVVVDNTYWNDLVDRGWSPDSDGAVWFYKVDSDPLVRDELEADYESIDYLVWTYTMRDNAGPLVREAHENSEVLWTQGAGDEAVEVRRVLTRAEVAERTAAEEARAEAERAAEARALVRAEAERTASASEFPGLTVGQVEAMRQEHAAGVPVERLASKYVATPVLVRQVLSRGDNGA